MNGWATAVSVAVTFLTVYGAVSLIADVRGFLNARRLRDQPRRDQP